MTRPAYDHVWHPLQKRNRCQSMKPEPAPLRAIAFRLFAQAFAPSMLAQVLIIHRPDSQRRVLNLQQLLAACNAWVPPAGGPARRTRCSLHQFRDDGFVDDLAAVRRADVLVRVICGARRSIGQGSCSNSFRICRHPGVACALYAVVIHELTGACGVYFLVGTMFS